MNVIPPLLAAWAVVSAQLAPPNPRGVAMAHVHLNVSDFAGARHFWIDILGAQSTKIGSIEGVRVPGAFVFFKHAAPTGGTVDSVINHLGLSVKELAIYPPLLRAAGIPFTENVDSQQIMIDGPEGLRLELTEDSLLTSPVAHHHVHFYTAQVPEMRAWYAATFGAIPGMRGKFDAADIPGANLSFSKSAKVPAGSKGRSVDHVGFEIADLQAFCKRLEAGGIKFDIPFTVVPELGVSTAFFTDPWGTYIELTEGLRGR